MALDPKGSGDFLGVSRLKQSDQDTAAALDALIVFNESSGIELAENREDDQEEKTGQVEATEVDVLDRSAEGELTMDKATPDGFAWMAAMFCNEHSASNPSGSVYLHTSKITSYAEHPAYFTVGHRKGGAGGAPAGVREHIGLGINQLTISGAKEEFLTLSASVLGLGKYNDGLYHQTEAVDLSGALTITLDFDPTGADDTERAANVTLWLDEDDDGQFEVQCPVVSYVNGTGVLTFTDPTSNGVDTRNVRASFVVDATETTHYGSPSWLTTLEALTAMTEFKLKAANTQLIIGAVPGNVIPATPYGQIAGCEVQSFEYQGDWQGEPGKCWRAGASSVDHATSVNLGDLRQTLTLDRQVQDYLLAANFDANTPIGFLMEAIGPDVETGYPYRCRLYLPRLKMLEKPQSIEDGKWQDSANFLVLKDAVNDYPTAIFETQNGVSTYLA